MLPELGELEALIAAIADEELLPRFRTTTREVKADGTFVTAADLAMQHRLTQALAQRWPEYALLGEEMDEAAQRALLHAPGRGMWCLDPLDGTSNYAAGLPFFAVSLALIIDGEPVLGVVYDPLRRECFSACNGDGAWLNGVPMHTRPAGVVLNNAIAVVDFKRLAPPLATRLAQQPPYGSQRSFGSVALDWCWLAVGRYHVYLHGRQSLWDFAAGWLILREAGGQAVTLEGDEVYRPDIAPRSAVAALDPQLFTAWRQWLG